MRKLFLFSVLLLAVTGTSLKAQLTGTLNVPGSYATLAAAITDLNTQGVGTGGVTINLLAGNPQTAPAGGYAITATGIAVNIITIQGNGNTITASSAHTVGALNDAIFKIIGGDYIHINSFVMTENALNTVLTSGTNTKTEWGVALLYASATDGAQHNFIVGNTITLDRTYANTWGIYSNTRHTATAPTVTADITSPSGSNSSNNVYGNTISNVNMGIAFIGSNAAANQDIGNQVGGGTAITGNTISNWGGSAAASSYISNSGTSYCIFMNHQTAMNVAFNTIASATVTPTVTFRGIVQDYTATNPTGSFTNSINNNTITMTSAQTSGTFRAIDCAGGVNTMILAISNNTILNSAITGVASTSLWGGIFNSGAVATVNINNNILRGGTSDATGGGFTGIQNSGAVANAVNIIGNQIGNASGNAITFSAVQTAGVNGIINTGGGAGSVLSILSNNFQGFVHSVTGSSTHTYISNTAVNPSTSINANTFTNITMNSTGSVTFISNNVTHVPNTTHFVNNNSVVTGFNKTGAGGTVLFYNSFSTSLTAVTETNNGNNFSNLTFTGATTITGWRCGDGSTTAPFGPAKTVTNNTFANITGGSSNIQILEVGYSNSNSSTNNVSGNAISNITGGSTITGLLSSQGNQNFFNNTVTGITSTGGGLVIGISITGGAAQNVYNNKIGNLESVGAGGQVAGIRVSSGTSVNNIYNNLVGDLRAPSASGANAVMGISVTSSVTTQTINLFYNTIYLNAGSTGTDFGSSGIQANTGPALDLRNNLVVNTSTPNGTGLTVAYRRNNTTLSTYAATSGNNSFYAGIPSASHVIFYDGANSDQTIVDFRTRVFPIDAMSITANPTFASTTASSTSFLHIPAATPSGLESAGTAIPSVTTLDFDNDTRPGPIPSVNGGGTAPDIGADEFDGVPGCHGAPSTVIPNGSPAFVCGSGTFTLSSGSTPTGEGIAYQWQEATVSGGPYTNIPGATSTTYTTAAISSTMYYVFMVTCANSGLTSVSSEIVATVNPIPTVTASVTQSTVCDGQSVTFTGGGADTYTWTGGVTDNSPFTPTVTDSYTVTGTDINGCTNDATVSVTVNPLPTVTANTTATAVCDGGSVTLNGGGATSYTWTGGVTDNLAFTPLITDTYTVTGTDANGCSNMASVIVTVNALPTVSANATSAAVCSGDAVTVNGGGASTYVWTGGVTDNVAFTPLATDTYTVTGTDVNGCTNTASVTVSVNALPTVTASVTTDTVCAGTPVTFNGGGANSYTWTGGVTDNVAFTPSATNTYTVTGTDVNGCTNTATAAVAVNLLPVVTFSLPMDTLCQSAGTITLSGESPSGGTWSGPGVSGNTFDPVISGVGTFGINYLYTDVNGCTATTTDSISVDLCLGIVSETTVNGTSVFPNPTSGSFTVELSGSPSSPVNVEIMNELGQVVDSFTMSGARADVNISELEGGIYFVRLINGSEVSIHRVVKQ